MVNSKKFLIGWTAFLSVVFLSGCGEVSESPGDLNRLKIAFLSPQDGEEGVQRSMLAIVVFNDSVNFATGAANVNGSTFYLEESGGVPVIGFTVEESELDSQQATALIVLPDPSPLQSGSTYYVVVEGSIKGKNTDPLGTRVRNEFIVQ